MGQTASQIENHIDNQRESLGSNLHELESKVKSFTDWRQQFEAHPMTFIGIAFGGGVMLAAMTGGHTSSRGRGNFDVYPRNAGGQASSSHTSSPAMDKAHHAIETIKAALVGVAVARAKDYAEQIIPGFSRHYQETEGEQKSNAAHV